MIKEIKEGRYRECDSFKGYKKGDCIKVASYDIDGLVEAIKNQIYYEGLDVIISKEPCVWKIEVGDYFEVGRVFAGEHFKDGYITRHRGDRIAYLGFAKKLEELGYTVNAVSIDTEEPYYKEVYTGHEERKYRPVTKCKIEIIKRPEGGR